MSSATTQLGKKQNQMLPTLTYAHHNMYSDDLLTSLLRLGAQSVTLLSTLRDPTQLRRRQCACPCYAMFE